MQIVTTYFCTSSRLRMLRCIPSATKVEVSCLRRVSSQHPLLSTLTSNGSTSALLRIVSPVTSSSMSPFCLSACILRSGRLFTNLQQQQLFRASILNSISKLCCTVLAIPHPELFQSCRGSRKRPIFLGLDERQSSLLIVQSPLRAFPHHQCMFVP